MFEFKLGFGERKGTEDHAISISSSGVVLSDDKRNKLYVNKCLRDFRLAQRDNGQRPEPASQWARFWLS
jgi:hypothetical protein